MTILVTDVFLERLLDGKRPVYRFANGPRPSTVNVGATVVQQAPVCEPLQVGDGTGVAIHGHMNGEGTWFVSPGATPVCDASASAFRYAGIIGNLTTGLPASMSLARSITVNIDRFREFCLARMTAVLALPLSHRSH